MNSLKFCLKVLRKNVVLSTTTNSNRFSRQLMITVRSNLISKKLHHLILIGLHKCPRLLNIEATILKMVLANKERLDVLQLLLQKISNVSFVLKLMDLKLQQLCICEISTKLELSRILKEVQASVFVRAYYSLISQPNSGFRNNYK